MAGSGFFLGGLAEGAQTAAKQGLAERSLSEQTGIAHRGLDIREASEARAAEQQRLERGDKLFSEFMGQINETVKAAVSTGTPPEVLMSKIEPMVARAEQFGGLIGRPPGMVRSTIQAMFTQPAAKTDTTKAAKVTDPATSVKGLPTPNVPHMAETFVVENIRRKLTSGEALTPDEMKVYDDALKADPMARLLSSRLPARPDPLKVR